MRTLSLSFLSFLSFLFVVLAACQPARKPEPPVGSPELLTQHATALRGYLARELAGCDYGNSVKFDGEKTYVGRAFRKTDKDEAIDLVFKLERGAWRCDEAETTPAGACKAEHDRCKK